ncbi:MAG: Type III pantothenate kinase [Candidatus Omnitrophica bacterium ADurb.Bin314]|jgi:type III pantothenate kinase|nr:MAG: Type III pantothenate kinase [Candidatus Omnitrophica bacterium ADurb.Bin314]
MGKCLLAIDIGNTASKVGLYKAGRFLDHRTMKFNAVPVYANKLIKSGKYPHLDIVICSVNPEITALYKNRLLRHNDTKLVICGKDIEVKIRHKYIEHNRLGIDRRVSIYGAVRMYRLPLLVLSYGTALTCDYIDAKGCFRGGMIIPGPDTALKALGRETALLPTIHFPSKRTSFLGRTTIECMESGILEGYGSLTDELVRRFKSRYGSSIRVIATGGLARTIASCCSSLDVIDPMHVLKSLMALWRDNLRS